MAVSPVERVTFSNSSSNVAAGSFASRAACKPDTWLMAWVWLLGVKLVGLPVTSPHDGQRLTPANGAAFNIASHDE